MRVLLVQPPRRYWPYTSEGDNFLLQQALPALGAVVRDEGHEVRIVDCMPLHVGWRSLFDIIRDYAPDVIGCGENHALYCNEALRFFRLCKEAAPDAVTVAGGGHFTNLAHRYVHNPDIDVIGIGEGEETFAAICNAVAGGSRPPESGWDDIHGIAFARDGEMIRTTPRRLIKDLDTIPMPAYDQMPMHLYGTSRYLFSPGGSTLHHSRGCVSKCSFCAWWTTMADRSYDADGNAKLRPRWRSKSVDKMMDEVEELYYRYGKRSYVWVDESWNIDPKFNQGFSRRMIDSGMKTKWMTFMRADCIVRDHERGILADQVKAGLAHILIGVERAEDDTLTGLDKRFYTGGIAEKAISIFKENFPEVFIQATFIVGVKNESQDTLARQVELAQKLDVDFPAFHPITPVPGTPIFDDALANGHITMEDFDDFDWLSPVLDTDYMTRDEISMELYRMNKKFVNPRWILRGLTSKVDYKRDMYIWFAKVSAQMAAGAIKKKLSPLDVSHYQALVKPAWYDA
ncbi:MAG: radical SAM protein [Proteobacteria bacterium]|nr:radical SAM protein [Pseudomonadota bacterium]MCP4917576.1 radical SAM protein [Pseudomonadota bacterium]